MYSSPVLSTIRILVLTYVHNIPFFSTTNILVLLWFSMQRTSKEFLVRTKVGRGKTNLLKQYSSNNYVLKHKI